MASDPDGTVRQNDGETSGPGESGATGDSKSSKPDSQNPEQTIAGQHAAPDQTQSGFDETVVQGSQFEHLTEQNAPTSMLGQFGRYMIQGKLGEGGMGAVYIARDTQLDRDIALKIPKFSPDDKVSIEWFYREARAMATVHHPNLCPVFDVGVIDNIHYMSMAYIEGRPLTDFVKSKKPIQPRQVAAVIRKIALALEEAHQAGIVHRDLKPDNVMINTRKEPVIMDFGLARRENPNEAQLTKTGQVMGTPSYMAPEQVEGNNELIGPRTDVYSLGVIMYQMLCGELPFKGVVTLVLAKIITEEPPAPSAIKADVDSELERICLKAKHRVPEQRYQSAAEMAKDLKKYLSGSSTGDTMRRAKMSKETAKEVTQTDQLANEYFDAAPYSYNEPTGEFTPSAEPEADPLQHVTEIQTSFPQASPENPSEKTALRSATAANPALLKIGGVCAAVLVAIVLFLAFGPSGNESEDGTADSTAGKSGETPGEGSNGGDSTGRPAFGGTKKVRKKRDGRKVAPPGGQASPQKQEPPERNFALQLNGQDSFVELPLSYDGTHPLTIEAIVHRTDVEDDQAGVHIVSDVESAGVGLLFQDGDWQFVAKHEGGYVKARSPHDGTIEKQVHVAGVYEGGSVRLYVDGKKVADESGRGALVASSVNLVLGANPGRNGGAAKVSKTGSNSYYQFFEGRIDEVRISAVARYASDFAPPTEGARLKPDENTLALYHCDTLQNGLLVDSSAHGHHGFVYNGQLVDEDGNRWAPRIRRTPYDADIARQEQRKWAQVAGVDTEWENSIGMSFRLIPPGTFRSGTPQAAIDAAVADAEANGVSESQIKQEQVARDVTIVQPFYMAMLELTSQNALDVFGELPERRAGPRHHTMAHLSIRQAMRFCNRLSIKEGRTPWYLFEEDQFSGVQVGTGYRLPTRTEWEYACRAGTHEVRYWDAVKGKAEDYEWFGDRERRGPHPPGMKKPNPFGLFDMLGNARELVQFDDLQQPPRRPTMFAGGSWSSEGHRLRAAAFAKTNSAVVPSAGLRVVLPLSSPSRFTSRNGTVDLLSQVRPERDAVSASWRRQDSRVIAFGGNGYRALRLPVHVEGNFELEIEFTRQDRGQAFEVLLPVEGRYAWFVLSLVRDGQPFTGISTGRTSRDLDGSLASTDLNILDGQQYTLLLRTVRDGENVTVTASVDGQQLHARTVNISKLTSPRFAAASGKHPVLGAFESGLTIHAARLTMLNGEATIDATPTPVRTPQSPLTVADGSVDLLPHVDVIRDGEKARWTRTGSFVETNLETESECGILPAEVRGDFEIQLDFERVAGSDSLFVQFPVEDHVGRLVLAGWAHDPPTRSGIDEIDGKGIERQPDAHRGFRIENGRRYRLGISVKHVDEEQVDLRISIDEQELFTRRVRPEQLGVPEPHQIDPHRIGIGSYLSKYRFHSAKLRMISDETRLLAEPAVVGQLRTGQSVDLVSQVDLTSDVHRGIWAKENGKLDVIRMEGERPTCMFPAMIDGDYRITLTLEQIETETPAPDFSIYLPVGEKHAVFVLAGWGDGQKKTVSGFGCVGNDGGLGHQDVHRGFNIQTGKRYRIQVEVKQNRNQVEMVAVVDGEEISRWNVEQASLTAMPHWGALGQRAPGVTTYKSRMRVHSATLEMLRGEADLKTAPPTKLP